MACMIRHLGPFLEVGGSGWVADLCVSDTRGGGGVAPNFDSRSLYPFIISSYTLHNVYYTQHVNQSDTNDFAV